MIEKLKDFFFDFSDTLFSIFIILIMALVITWKLSGAMSIPLFNDTKDKLNIVKIEDTGDISTNNPNNTEAPQKENIEEADPKKPANSNEGIQIIQQEDLIDIKVEIPKGTTGSGIAKILKDQGLINSTNEFINRVEELKLGPKLRFGTFTIKSDSSLDHIISIITGVSGSN